MEGILGPGGQSALNLAEAVVRQLGGWGVQSVFGVAGDDLLPFLDALGREPGIRWVATAHEAGAAFAAAAWAALTGELGVCVASAAGAVNLTEGLMEAGLDGLPVLALTGQVAVAKLGVPAKQRFDQQRLVGTAAVCSELVSDAQAGVRLLFRAASQALLREGVAHLSIPADLWEKEVEAVPAALPALVAAARPAHLTETGTGEEEAAGDLRRVAGLMRAARRPLILAGRRGRGAEAEIQRLAEVWRAPLVVAQEAKGLLSESRPEVIGGAGETWLPAVVGECDCVLLVGRAAYEEPFLPPVPIVQVERYPWQVDDRHLWNSLAGDPAAILSALAGRLASYRPDPAWGERLATARTERAALIAGDAAAAGVPVHPGRLMVALSRVVAPDALLVLDVGAFVHWFDRDFRVENQRVLTSSLWRSMGRALPGALAAQLRCPERQVIALAGDGGMLMSLGELATIAAHRAPVKVVVADDRRYALEAEKAAARGLEPPGLDVPPVDFARCAEAFGVPGFRVEWPEELEPALAAACAASGPALVDVVCRDVRLPYHAGNP